MHSRISLRLCGFSQIIKIGWSNNGGFRSGTEEPMTIPNPSAPLLRRLTQCLTQLPSSSDVRWEEGGSRGLHPPIDVSRELGDNDQNKWPSPSHDMMVPSAQCSNRTAGTALLSTTPGWMTNRWKPLLPSRVPEEFGSRVAVRPSSDGSHLPAKLPTSVKEGGVRRIDRVFWSHQPAMAPLSIVNRLRFTRAQGWIREGATHATGLLELPETARERADDSGPARPVTEVFDILSPAHDRHPPEPPHGVAPLPKEAGIIGRLVPRPSTQRHLGPPNTAKHSLALAVDAGSQRRPCSHMSCPRCVCARCCPRQRRSGSVQGPKGQGPPLPWTVDRPTLAPGPHGWLVLLLLLSGLGSDAFPAMLVTTPFL